MNFHSIPANRSATARMWRTLKSTLSTAVILHWTRRQIRSQRWCKDSRALYAKGAWCGGWDESALCGANAWRHNFEAREFVYGTSCDGGTAWIGNGWCSLRCWVAMGWNNLNPSTWRADGQGAGRDWAQDFWDG